MKKTVKLISIFLFLSLIPVISKGYTLKIDTVNACIGDTIYVPVNVSSFTGIAAISLIIDYDPAVTTFLGITNVHSEINGAMANAVSSPKDEIRVGWFSFGVETADIGTGKLFDLELIYHGGAQNLVFDPNSELADNNHLPVTAIFIDGRVEQGITPFVNTHPVSINACSGDDISFNLVATDAVSYQWQVNDGAGWTNVYTSPHYAGNNTDSLIISNLTTSLNQNQYRCLLINQCYTYSNTVTLQVSEPIVSAGQDDTICFGDQTTLNAIVNGGFAPFNYDWGIYGQSATINVSPTSTQSYTVLLTDSFGCVSSDDVSVIVSNPVTEASTNDTICIGASSTLQAQTTGGIMPYSYSWLHGASQAQTVVSPTNDMTYYITVTDNAGCISEDSVAVAVSNPVVYAGNDDSLCIGNSTLLNSSVSGGYAPFQYLWSNQTTTPENNVTPSTTTTFSVSVTDRFFCSTNDDVTVVVSEPVTVADGNDTLCLGQSKTLTALTSGGIAPYYYEWDNTQTGSSINVTPISQTSYKVTVTDFIGCISEDSLTLWVSDPIVNTGPNDTICIGTQSTISATGSGGYQPYSYLWSSSGTGSSTNVSPVSSQWFSVTLTDAVNCNSSDSLFITVSDPSVDIGSNDTICIGVQHILQATPSGGIGTYQYLWSTSSTSQTINVSPTSTSTYSITITDEYNCTATDSKSVLVSDPTADAGSDQNVCIGLQATFSATASGGFPPYSYQWNGIPGQQYQVLTTTNQTNVLSVTDNIGCVANDTNILTALPNPSLTVSPDDTVCINTNALITALATGGTGSIDYLWSNNANTSTINPLMMQSTLFSVTATDVNNCADSTEVMIIVSDPQLTLGNNDTVCYGDSVFIASQISGGFSPFTYNWSTGDSLPQINFTANIDTCVSLNIADKFGCISNDTICILVSDISLTVSSDTIICPNDPVNLSAISAGGFGITGYQWSTGDNTSTIVVQPYSDSLFVITVNDEVGCTASDSIEILIHPLPVPDLGPNDTICINHIKTLDPGSGFITYLWSTGDNTQTIEIDGTVIGTGSHQFSVTVTNQYSCSNSDTVNIYVDPCINVENLSNKTEILIHPNPASYHFDINMNYNGRVNLIMISTSGKIIMSEEYVSFVGKNHRISVDYLAPGLYFLIVQTSDGLSTKRILIQ